MRGRRGFTLVELLVVIGIIVCLLAILLPVVAMMRESARCTICASNQHQIVEAIFAYANDNRGELPDYSLSGVKPYYVPYAAVQMIAWGKYDYSRGALWPYIGKDVLTRKRLFSCPSDDADPRFAGDFYGKLDALHPRNFSYNFNGSIGVGVNRATSAGGIRVTQIVQPWHKVLVMEEQLPRFPAGSVESLNPDADKNNPSEPMNYLLLSTRHSGECNEGFADGHVERIDPNLFQGAFTDGPGMGWEVGYWETYYYFLLVGPE